MDMRALRTHALVMIATCAGIIGMGTVFTGVMQGNLHTILQGTAPLLLGLWWAGHELGRSMLLVRGRRSRGRRRRARTVRGTSS